jgi:hypothetical protein
MATILPDDQKKKPNSFGDAAAAAASPGLGVQQIGSFGFAAPATAAAVVPMAVAPQQPAVVAGQGKPNSLGDAAAVSASPGLGIQQIGASIPAPLPMLTAGTPPIQQTAQVRADDAAAAAGPIAKAAAAAC